MLSTVDGKKVISRSVQIPLKPEAIQLVVMGTEDQQALAVQVSETILRSVDGKSNWLSDEERSESLGQIVGLGVGGAIAIPIALWFRSRRKKAQAELVTEIEAKLNGTDGVSVPALADALGMKGLAANGKILMALNDLIKLEKVEVIPAPEGTPMLKKIDHIRYRLRSRLAA